MTQVAPLRSGMDFAIVGLSHHTAPLELRERLAVPEAALNQAYRHFDGAGGREGMVLSTCNRVEVLMHGLRGGAVESATLLLSELSGLAPAEFRDHLRIFQGDDAVRHAFRVASGLDSMVLGEPQILGQWKAAFLNASDRGACGPYVTRLGQRTLQIAKRARSETEIGRFAVNMARLAVDLAEQIFEPLDQKGVVVLGAGEMAELAATHFHERGIRQLTILNRTRGRAEEVAARFAGAKVADFAAWPEHWAAADVIIVGVGGDGRIFDGEAVRRAVRLGPRRPRLVVDLAVPRAVDPAVGRLNDLFLYAVDDLEGLSRQNMARRQAEAERADVLIDEAVRHFADWYAEQRVSPALGELSRALEELRVQEVARTLNSPHGRGAEELLDAATRALTRRLVQRVAQHLRADRDPEHADAVLRALVGDPEPELDEERDEAADR